MKGKWFVSGCLLLVAWLGVSVARADIGWNLSHYEQRYGKGQRGYARIPEVGFEVGDSRLVVQLDGDRSVAEIWNLGTVRTGVPESVLAAGREAMKGPQIEVVQFKAFSAIPAEIHQSIIDGVVVRADVRNQYLKRVAFCGREPVCSWWYRLLWGCEEKETVTCDILERALHTDRNVDRLQAAAERSLNRRR